MSQSSTPSQPRPEDHLDLAQKAAAIWARRFPYAADDLLSVAYLALLEACERWNGKGTFRGYANQIMSWRLKTYLIEDRTVRVPQPEITEGRADYVKVQGGDATRFLTAAEDEANYVIPDLTETEQRILELRLEGRTLQEIAKELGFKSHANVIYYIKKIQEKWLKDNS